jgi:hypothetical protein
MLGVDKRDDVFDGTQHFAYASTLKDNFLGTTLSKDLTRRQMVYISYRWINIQRISPILTSQLRFSWWQTTLVIVITEPHPPIALLP